MNWEWGDSKWKGMIMLNAFIAIYNLVREKEWQNYKRRRKHRLVNKDFTVIASNCSGMFMYYDMGCNILHLPLI